VIVACGLGVTIGGKMLIIDSHLDLSWNALQWDRDLLKSVYSTRQIELPMTGKGRSMGTVALPEMRQGRVFVSFATLLARCTGKQAPSIDYGSVAQAHAIAKGQMAYYRALEKEGHVHVIETANALEQHHAVWQEWDLGAGNDLPPHSLPLGFVISMEGADPITTPEELEEWYALGLRLLGPAHYGTNRYAGGTGTELPLTEGMGVRLLKEMRRLGMGMDCTHLSDESFWQAVRVFDGPVLASHQNCRAIAPVQRQFTDDQLKVIIERGGVIGASFDISMVRSGWQYMSQNNLTERNPVMMSEIVDHIDRVCQLAGNANHSALGTDLDGGFGREQSPLDLDTIADLQKMTGLLKARGYADDDVTKIMYGNWLRFLQTVL
jgi:membrane dipeptidase